MPGLERQFISKINSYHSQFRQTTFFENDEWQEPELESIGLSQGLKKSKASQLKALPPISAILEEDDIEEV